MDLVVDEGDAGIDFKIDPVNQNCTAIKEKRSVHLERVWPLTRYTSDASMAVPPTVLLCGIPFGTAVCSRRAMKRSSPTVGSAVVL